MNISGSPTLHPLIFYPVKISLLILAIAGTAAFSQNSSLYFKAAFIFCYAAAILIMIPAFLNLGSSLKMGLPLEPTEFKSGGLYRISRNPIYISFALLMIGCIIILPQLYYKLWAAAVIAGHHYIILGEEKFLAKRFGSVWQAYVKRVRRYL